MKISIVGAGNAGCFTALHFGWHILSNKYDNVELELIYDPDISPEPVGQATVLEPPDLLWAATGFNWYKNPICLLYTSPSPRDKRQSRMPSSA